MPTRDQADTLLGQLGGLIGIPDLALDGQGTCTLVLGGGEDEEIAVTVLHDPAGGGLSLLARLGEDEAEDDVLRGLLEANYLWLGADGATFAIDPESGSVALLRPVGEAEDAQGMHATLERFVAAALRWREQLVPGGGGADLARILAEEEPPAPVSPLHGIRV